MSRQYYCLQNGISDISLFTPIDFVTVGNEILNLKLVSENEQDLAVGALTALKYLRVQQILSGVPSKYHGYIIDGI